MRRFIPVGVLALLVAGALCLPRPGVPTVQGKDGTGLEKIPLWGEIRIELQSHHTWDQNQDAGTENRHKVTEYQVEGLSHDALNQWDSPGGVPTTLATMRIPQAPKSPSLASF